MAAFDKLEKVRELVEKGWTEVPDTADRKYMLIPPQLLWDNRPPALYVYDAEALQDLLNPTEEED